MSLSFWVARNLTLSARDRLALFVVDNALLRLYMEVRDIARVRICRPTGRKSLFGADSHCPFLFQKSVLCCCACATEIARREHVFAMSSDGLHGNYTNLRTYRADSGPWPPHPPH